MLALSFLLLIGVTLLADGFGFHVEKGYIYAAMGFAVFVEALNLAARKRHRGQAVDLHPTFVKDEPATPGPEGGSQPGDELVGHHEPGVALRVGPKVAVVVRATRLDEAQEPRGRGRRGSRLGVERAVVGLQPIEPLGDQLPQERHPLGRLPEVGD